MVHVFEYHRVETNPRYVPGLRPSAQLCEYRLVVEKATKGPRIFKVSEPTKAQALRELRVFKAWEVVGLFKSPEKGVELPTEEARERLQGGIGESEIRRPSILIKERDVFFWLLGLGRYTDGVETGEREELETLKDIGPQVCSNVERQPAALRRLMRRARID